MPPPKDPYRYFRIEARELLDQLGRGVLALEKSPEDAQAVPRLLRLAHTLKGAARVVKQREIADAAHAIEEVLAPLREGGQPAQRAQIDAVLARLDDMATHLAALAAPPGTADQPPGTDNKPAELPPALPAMLASDGAEREALLDGLAQTHAQVTTLRQGVATAQRARRLVDLLAAPRPAAQQASMQSVADELRTLLGSLEQRLASSLDQIDRELQQVRDTAEQLHLVPAAALFMPLERTARDAAQALGKHVMFEGHGGDVRLDAQVLGLLQGALVQMVRNAVAHGVEPAAQRLAAGKPPEGRVRLDVARQGRRVVFICSDDGAGVDLDAVRQAAQRKGGPAAAPQALDTLDAQALLHLLLHGGLSTAAQVTEVAGRGIGLDLVRDTAQRLGAELAVHTTAGQGTRLQITVPVSIAALPVLEVQVAGMVAAIPLDGVRSTLRHDPRQIARTAQGDSLVHDGQALPFIMLARVLQAAAPAGAARAITGVGSAVIVQGAQGLAAIGVDRLLGAASVVMRPLPDLTPADPVVAGASLDVQGQPQLVLDPEGLVQHARRATALPVPAEAARVPVLVVDDSLTTRMLEQSILESAGYLVHAAVSAEDALERARQQRYALFLVDVEMPGMDGFGFIERTRADPQLRDVPAILVTSRASPEDRRRGREVGAQGYIVKSEFAQAEFLQRVQELTSEPA
jgi:two-component system chemotaxis sensor kinase CheA